MSSISQMLFEELGLPVLLSAPRDAHFLILQRMVRLFAYGQSTLVLASFLHELGISDFQLGLFMTLTLVGDVAGSVILTVFADQWGRRKVLTLGCGLMSLSGVVFCLTEQYVLLLLAAMVGVISPSGNEIGPFKAIEESALATLIPKEHRSTIFAWYAVCSGLAGSAGSLSGGWIMVYLQSDRGWSSISAYRFIFGMYAMCGLIKGGLTRFLSDRCEVIQNRSSSLEDQTAIEEETHMIQEGSTQARSRQNTQEFDIGTRVLGLTKETRSKVRTLSFLFGLDNLASGLVPLSFVIYFFSTKFSLDKGTLGTTFFTTSLVAALSNLIAASLARRIGNIRTMAFTHLPSALLLALIPLPSRFGPARLLLIARFCTAQMDGAPRTAFLANYVPDDERTSVMGILNVVKTLCQSAGPTITGYLAGKGWIGLSFLAAGCMKASYDLMMLYFFYKVV